jgi:hypothetical protein
MAVGLLVALALAIPSALAPEPAITAIDARLIAGADHVVIGVVTGAPDGRPTVAAEEYFKSSRFPARLVLSMAPRPSVGERVLLFLADQPSGGVRLVDDHRGFYLLVGDVAIPAGGGAPVSRARLEARIRALVRVPPPAYGGAVLLGPPSLAAQTADADLVVVAWVDDVTGRRAAGGATIETDVRLQVERVLKGGAPASLRLTLPGGAVGNARLQVGGVPRFWPGERVLLFLRARPTGLVLVGLWQGKYSLVDGVAVQPERGVRTALADLERRVADAVAGVVVDPDDAAQSPVEAEFATFCQPWGAAQAPVAFSVNPDRPGTGAPEGPAFVRLVQQGLQTWQDVEGAWIAAAIGGTTSRPATDHFDGQSDVAWADLDAYGGGLLAVNFCSSENGVRTDADVLLDNSGRVWSTAAAAGTVDLDSVVRHELGHALGLGHTLASCDSGPATPLMCPAIARGVEKTLQPDDVAGLVALYPLAGPPPPAPGAVTAEAAGEAAVLVAWPAGGGLADEVQRADGGCDAPFRGVATVAARPGRYLDDDLGAGLASGLYCYRVTSLGPGGDSAPSEAAPVAVRPRGGLFVATGNLDGVGADEIVTGAGAGSLPHVRAFGADGAALGVSFMAYDPAFRGGVRVASCDLDGDGRAEIVTAAGPGGGPHVRAWQVSGRAVSELLGFYAYEPGFAGGVWLACGDVDGDPDGRAEIVTGAGPGAAPHVRVWKVRGTRPALAVTELTGFFAYDAAFGGGVRVAVADVDGDGRADVITGAGPGGGPHVRVFRLGPLTELASFYAYDPAFTGGVFVGARDLDGLPGAEIVTGAGAGGGPHVRIFRWWPFAELAGFYAYDPAFTGGVAVGAGRLGSEPGTPEVVSGAGPGGGPHVRGFALPGRPTPVSFMAY